MTPAQRVYAVLRGEIPDQVPFTVYEYLMDGFPFEQSLREQGACVVHRGDPQNDSKRNCG